MINLIFYLSLSVFFYTWFIYPFLLLLLNQLYKNNILLNNKGNIPFFSIIISAYNEEKVIENRIRNILQQNYPKDKLEIIIASDGSTDRTVEIANQFKNGIKVLDFKQNRGRAAVQNDAIKEAIGEIIVFTDAETEFKKSFLKNIVKYFCNSTVGCVVGNLTYKAENSSISQSEGLYFKFEKKIRELESRLGILATATGACMAVKKTLWRDLTPIDDCDFTTPLDVILQGYKVVFAKDAIAYDIPPSSIKGELKARIRQTSKNFIGTLKRWGLKGWIKHPFVSWGLLSHKILRWLTPFFMISLFISNIFLLNESWTYKFIFIGQIIFYTLAVLGFIGEIFKKAIPIASTIFSFCVANIGMGIGVIKGLLGKAPAVYKMEK